jgi:hypothetical protein
VSAPPRDVYRLALYGRSGSGKTCLLAALSLPRRAHPEGLSITWVADAADSPAHVRGREAIAACGRALREGRKPPPTPPTVSPFPRLRFTVSAARPQPSTFVVELIDYSGELIDPGTDARTLAASLRAHLREADALLVVGEVARPGQEEGKLHHELELLRQAFASLRQERSGEPALRLPVALLLNKWDRLHPASEGSAHDRKCELDDFLARQPAPPHVGLIHALRGAVATGCFQAFAVSAFGVAHQRVGEAGGPAEEDLPPPPPLPSFGLEEALRWAAMRRDTLELGSVQHDNGELRWGDRWPWLCLNSLNPFPPFRLAGRAKRLRHRSPPGSEMRREARAVQLRCRRLGYVRVLMLALFVALSLLGAEAGIDGYRQRAVRGDLERPDRGAEQIAADEAWLEEYAVAPGYRHLLSRLWFSRADARALVEGSRRKRDDGSWALVEAAADDVGRAQTARDYLAAFPNGRHADEAGAALQKAEEARAARENQAHLDGVRQDLKGLLAGRPDLASLRKLGARLRQVPHPGRESQEQFDTWRKLNDEIGDALVGVSARGFREKFDALMAGGQVVKAGALLAEQKPPPPDLVASFRDRALGSAEAELNECLTTGRWRAADAVLDRLKNADPAVIKLLGDEADRKLATWRRRRLAAEDRALYEALRAHKNVASARAYLDAAHIPDKPMKKEAAAYQEYLLAIDRELDLTLRLSRIEWGNAWDRQTDYWVTVNGKTVMQGKVQAKDSSVATDVDAAKIRFRLGDEVTVAANATHYGYLKNTDYGTPSEQRFVRNLGKMRLELGGKSPASYMAFALEGVPEEPPLPPYRDQGGK